MKALDTNLWGNLPTKTVRGQDWCYFAGRVLHHVEDYTVPQYGDAPGDQIGSFTIEDFKTQLARYVNRIGKNVRGQEEALRDCLKIAHYAQLLHDKLKRNANETAG